MDGWKHRQTDRQTEGKKVKIYTVIKQKRRANRQTNRRTDKCNQTLTARKTYE